MGRPLPQSGHHVILETPSPYRRYPDGGTVHELRFPARSGPISWDRISGGDRAALALLAHGQRRVVDVGTFLGGSAEALIQAMPSDGRLVTIDTFRGTPGNETTAVEFHDALVYAAERLDVYEGRVSVMVGRSPAAASWFADEILDLVFLDAAHDYESVRADLDGWLPKLRPGGIMCGHDFPKDFDSHGVSQVEIMRRSMRQLDVETNVYWGVVRAVLERFGDVLLVGDEDSEVWAAEKL